MDENGDRYLGDMLEDTVAHHIDYIDGLQAGSEEYNKAIDKLDILYKPWLEVKRVELEFDDRVSQRIHEKEMREAELKQKEKFDKLASGIQVGLGVLSVLVPTIGYGLTTNQILRFEQTGTVTSLAGRNHFGKIRPTKIG
jgi:hypothetical protein